MNQLETELSQVKEETKNMWGLVRSQLSKGLSALLNFDRNLAREIVLREKRVNAFELKIDLDCENIFALYAPVAIDLRFLLAVLKINSNLERIGDIAEGIAKYILDAESNFSEALLDATQLIQMYQQSIVMLDETLNAFEKEDTKLARSVFDKDNFLDEININANDHICKYLQEFPDDLNQSLYALSIIRKLERVGDHVKNIAEENIFFIEAKVLKHSSKINKEIN